MNRFTGSRRKGKPPEQSIKHQICIWLGNQRAYRPFYWVNSSVGVWDQEKGIYRKMNSIFQMKGTADILGIWAGKPLAIEVKTPLLKDIFGKIVVRKTYPTIDQERFLKRFNEAGGIAFVARSVEDCEFELLKKRGSHEMKANPLMDEYVLLKKEIEEKNQLIAHYQTRMKEAIDTIIELKKYQLSRSESELRLAHEQQDSAKEPESG